MSNLGLASISRPTMNFCRLPPDSDLAAVLATGLHIEVPDDVPACFLQRPDLIQPLPLTESVRVS